MPQENELLTNECKALHLYNDKFRELINGKAQRQDLGDESFSDYIKRSLKLNKSEDWSFICSSMDIINDSLLGIENFIKFGIDGPTKYDDIGEKYIRLYGALNATYIQQQAVLNLYKISNASDLASADKKINELSIRDTRHKLGAHSVDYSNRETSTTESFVPVRFTLGGMNCEYFNNSTNLSTSVNLTEQLNEHVALMNEMYHAVYEKFAKTIYKANPEKYEPLIEMLSDILVIRKGGIALRGPDGRLILITSFVEA